MYVHLESEKEGLWNLNTTLKNKFEYNSEEEVKVQDKFLSLCDFNGFIQSNRTLECYNLILFLIGCQRYKEDVYGFSKPFRYFVYKHFLDGEPFIRVLAIDFHLLITVLIHYILHQYMFFSLLRIIDSPCSIAVRYIDINVPAHVEIQWANVERKFRMIPEISDCQRGFLVVPLRKTALSCQYCNKTLQGHKSLVIFNLEKRKGRITLKPYRRGREGREQKKSALMIIVLNEVDERAVIVEIGSYVAVAKDTTLLLSSHYFVEGVRLDQLTFSNTIFMLIEELNLIYLLIMTEKVSELTEREVLMLQQQQICKVVLELETLLYRLKKPPISQT
uniref:Uncharacterized protein n=1 Tax=Glossina brevipalpis TaxID=37001 RepID=A0A1A9WJP8_9MUSC